MPYLKISIQRSLSAPSMMVSLRFYLRQRSCIRVCLRVANVILPPFYCTVKEPEKSKDHGADAFGFIQLGRNVLLDPTSQRVNRFAGKRIENNLRHSEQCDGGMFLSECFGHVHELKRPFMLLYSV